MAELSARATILSLLFIGGCASSQVLRPPAPQTDARLPFEVRSVRYAYRVEVRDERWQPVRAESLSPGADLALQYGEGSALLLVFAEHVGGARLDDFLKRSQGHARLVAGAGAEWTSAEATTVKGQGVHHPAWLVEREVRRAHTLRYFSLVTVADGVGYSALCWGRAFTPRLRDTCTSALSGLRPLGQPVIRLAPTDAQREPAKDPRPACAPSRPCPAPYGRL